MNEISYLECTTLSSGKVDAGASFSIINTTIDKSNLDGLSLVDVKQDFHLHIHDTFRIVSKDCLQNSNYLPMLNSFENTIKLNICDIENSGLNEDYKSLLHEELKTWNLLSMLYYDRFRNLVFNEDSVDKNIFNTENAALKNLFVSNRDVREAQIVVDWLQNFMRVDLENNKLFLIGEHGKTWEYTKHNVKEKALMNVLEKRQFELDPDATFRGSLKLCDLDKNEENEYLRYLYHCIRAGELEKAGKLCEKREEFWRILTLEGWKPFLNPLLSEKDESCEMHDVTGNANRELFLEMCEHMSSDTNLNLYERGIYAIFCGNINVLLALEKEWSGILWVYFKVFVNENIRHYLRKFVDNGIFGTQSIFGIEGSIIDTSEMDGIIPGLKEFQKRDINGNSLCFKSLDQLFNEDPLFKTYNFGDILTKGPGKDKSSCRKFYSTIFYYVQKCIITNNIEVLVKQLELVVTKFPSHKSVMDKHVLRFLAHLVIFLYSIHDEINFSHYYTVLETYLECLLEMEHMDMITFFVSRLSTDLQINWYTKCLRDVTDDGERSRCVYEASQYELPIVEITCLVTGDIRRNAYTNSSIGARNFRRKKSYFKSPQSSFGSVVSERDQMQLDGLLWLVYLPDQYCYLIRHINALCRQFFKDSKFEAAKLAMELVTELIWDYLTCNQNESTQPGWLSSVLYENQCLKKYLDCIDIYAEWYNHYHKMRPIDTDLTSSLKDVSGLSFQEKQILQKRYEENQLSKEMWEKALKMYSNRMFNGLEEMLVMGDSGGWLSNIEDDRSWLIDYDIKGYGCDDDNRLSRERDVTELRGQCIPSIVMLLQQTLMISEQYKQCFKLAELLASENYCLYKSFTKQNLRKFLLNVKECSLKLLASGKDSTGFDL